MENYYKQIADLLCSRERLNTLRDRQSEIFDKYFPITVRYTDSVSTGGEKQDKMVSYIAELEESGLDKEIKKIIEKIDKLQKGNKEKTTKEDETKKEEDTSKTSEKSETTANKNIKSKEIPHTHDGINNQSYKHTNPEASLMTSLGRDQYGISKFKQNKNIIKGDE